jgi:hypothetical protein
MVYMVLDRQAKGEPKREAAAAICGFDVSMIRRSNVRTFVLVREASRPEHCSLLPSASLVQVAPSSSGWPRPVWRRFTAAARRRTAGICRINSVSDLAHPPVSRKHPPQPQSASQDPHSRRDVAVRVALVAAPGVIGNAREVESCSARVRSASATDRAACAGDAPGRKARLPRMVSASACEAEGVLSETADTQASRCASLSRAQRLLTSSQSRAFAPSGVQSPCLASAAVRPTRARRA